MIDKMKMLHIQDSLFNDKQTILAIEKNKGDIIKYDILSIEELVKAFKTNDEKIDSIATTKINSPLAPQINEVKVNDNTKEDNTQEKKPEPEQKLVAQIIEEIPEKEMQKDVQMKKYTFKVTPESFIQLPANCILFKII